MDTMTSTCSTIHVHTKARELSSPELFNEIDSINKARQDRVGDIDHRNRNWYRHGTKNVPERTEFPPDRLSLSALSEPKSRKTRSDIGLSELLSGDEAENLVEV